MAVEAPEVIPVTVGEGRTSIPVRNLWLLCLWASEFYDALDVVEAMAAEEDLDHLPELVSTILVAEVETRLRRSLTRRYVDRHDVLTAVRGRIDHLKTTRGGFLQRGQVVCHFQDLTSDSPRNRYVLAALRHAARHLAAHRSLRERCLTAAARLERAGISQAPPDLRFPRTERYGRGDQGDHRMVSAAQLLLDGLLPTTRPGGYVVRELGRDEHLLRRLYERAVRNLYRRHIAENAGGRVLHWPVGAGQEHWFPTMFTDITIERAGEPTVIVETKFSNALGPSRFHSGPDRLRRDHIFQLYAYLEAQATLQEPEPPAGVLLYPVTRASGPVHVTTRIKSYPFRVWTVDLAAPADAIRKDLLEAINFKTSTTG